MGKSKKSNLGIIIPIIFAVIIILIYYYLPRDTYPENVKNTLKLAGDNANELQLVLDNYKNDSLKLEAAYFLIGNMSGHCFVNYVLEDTSENEIKFNVNDYENYDQLIKSFDELENKHGVLDFNKKDKFEDIKTIKSDFLIRHIDAAFDAWRNKPWAKNLSFEDFCEYVLPYRGSNEPLEDWRQTFIESYVSVNLQMTDSTDPIEAAALINTDIMTYFTFDPRYYYHPTDQGLTEMLENGLGRCEDMTNITIYAFRANALAVTSDYTPYWANTGNNHAWNAILNRENKVIPFMGCEANPGEYKLHNKMAKAYRKMFSEQKQNLYFQKRKQEKMPRWLAGKNYKDVTTDYVDVCDVAVTFDKEIPDSVDIAYLCVFNSGEWKPIHWGKIENSTTTFTDMGVGIAYLPALYLNEEIVPYGVPFIL
ncbi:MAG: transglutaminase-like domain-containing protein, partial [Bacteroidota bacterium]|nr:transglutaminase-like domain-containing protein [Bacteroidota bacterium]